MSASGLDLARVALAAAKDAARKKGATTGAAKRPTARAGAGRRRDSSRDPVSLGDALAAVGRDRGWQDGTRAGTLLDRWTQLAPPEIARAAVPEGFDQEQRLLRLRPVSAAAATMLRWKARALVGQLNEALGAQALAAVEVLPPKTGTGTWSAPAPDTPNTAGSAREPGYVPGLRIGGGAPMPDELVQWRRRRHEEREQHLLDEARTQAAEAAEHHRRPPGTTP